MLKGRLAIPLQRKGRGVVWSWAVDGSSGEVSCDLLPANVRPGSGVGGAILTKNRNYVKMSISKSRRFYYRSGVFGIDGEGQSRCAHSSQVFAQIITKALLSTLPTFFYCILPVCRCCDRTKMVLPRCQ